MQSRRTHIGIMTQFFLSYCLAGIVAALVLLVLTTMHIHALTALACAGLVGGLAGLLLTFNIQLGLSRIEQALLLLARGQTAENPASGRQWPFTALFARLDQLNRIIEEQTQRETLTAGQRAQLLYTVSEAAVQEERNRLARELHDSIKQQIFSIGMSAAAIEARLSGGLGTVETPLADIQQSVQAAQSEMEALIQQLRPATLGITGVVENLRTQCQALAYRINGEATIEIGELPSTERLAPTTGDALQRILQEALSNIARHARAHKVSLSIGQEQDSLLVKLHDDGQGFAVKESTHGMGLANMQARANALGGSLQVQSRPGATTIIIRLPLVAGTSKSEERKVLNGLLRRAHSWYEYTNLCLQLTAVAILLALPFALVGTSICLTLLCLSLAYRKRYRVAQLAGVTSKEALALYNREYEISGTLCLVLGICAWYFPVALNGQAPHLLTILSAGASLVAVALALLLYWRYRGSITAYLRYLSPKERVDESKQHLRMLQMSLGIWLGVVVLALFIGQFELVFPPHTAEQWSSDATLALLVIWPVLELVNYALQGHFRARKTAQFE